MCVSANNHCSATQQGQLCYMSPRVLHTYVRMRKYAHAHSTKLIARAAPGSLGSVSGAGESHVQGVLLYVFVTCKTSPTFACTVYTLPSPLPAHHAAGVERYPELWDQDACLWAGVRAVRTRIIRIKCGCSPI